MKWAAVVVAGRLGDRFLVVMELGCAQRELDLQVLPAVF